MRAALKILGDVAAYRLRKLEMANLAAALSIGVALRLPLSELAWRMLGAALLNELIYLNNDYLDLEIDTHSAGRGGEQVDFLRDHRRTAFWLQWLLLALVVAVGAVVGPTLLLIYLSGAAICVAYSARLKRVPGADLASMALWGGTMALVGSRLDSSLGWRMALQLALFSVVFETLQVMRDHREDRRAGVMTTAVRLGIRRTAWVLRALMLVAALYGALYLSPLYGAALLVALVWTRELDDVVATWTRVKLHYGALWITMVLAILTSGGASGLMGRATYEDVIPFLSPLGHPR